MNNPLSKVFPLCLAVCLMALLTVSCANTEKNVNNTAENVDKKIDTAAGNPDWPAEMNQAIALAKKEKKVAVIEIFDEECNFCYDMLKTIKHPKVKEALDQMVYCKVYLEDSEALVNTYNLKESPTFLFYDHNGKYMPEFIQGFRPPKLFILELNNYKLRGAGKPIVEIPEDHNVYNHPSFGMG